MVLSNTWRHEQEQSLRPELEELARKLVEGGHEAPFEFEPVRTPCQRY